MISQTSLNETCDYFCSQTEEGEINAVSSEKGTSRILKICVVLSHRITLINVWHAFSRKGAYTFRFVATQK